jgi:stage V sporulation protein SpoVS
MRVAQVARDSRPASIADAVAAALALDDADDLRVRA